MLPRLPCAPFALAATMTVLVRGAAAAAAPECPNADAVEVPGAETQKSACLEEGTIMKAALDKACAARNLSRQGIMEAFHQLSGLGTGGLLAGTLDFRHVGQPSAKSVYLLQIDGKAAGGERALGGRYLSPTAKTYQAGSAS